MSGWRRHVANALPEHRWMVDRARSPAALWQQLYALAVEACVHAPPDLELLERLRRCAWTCCTSGGKQETGAIRTEFFERFFDDPRARPHLQRFLCESQFRHLEPAFASRFPPDEFAELRAQFFRSLADVEAGTVKARLRRLKDELLSSCPDEFTAPLHGIWSSVVEMLDVGEDLLAAEMFVDNLQDKAVPLSPSQEGELRAVLAHFGARFPEMR